MVYIALDLCTAHVAEMKHSLSVLCIHSNVLWFHIAKVGLLPLTHEVKVQWAVTEGAGSGRRAIEQKTCFLPNIHQFPCE